MTHAPLSKKWKTALIGSAAILGYYIWFQAFYNAVHIGTIFPYADLKAFWTGVAKNFPPVILECLFNLFIVFKLVKIRDLKAKICTDLVVSVLGVVLINYLYMFVSGSQVKDWAGTILADIIIFCIIELIYYFHRVSQLHREMEEATRRNLQYKYDALKAQIDPHFLFNSLNILNSLVTVDSELSQKFIYELSCMYRYVMAQHNRQSVSVKEELEFLSSYVSVLEMRYTNKFSVTVHGQPDAGNNIIPFTLQLLVENATKHNTITSATPMNVDVKFTSEGMTVSNPIHPKESVSVSHVGLKYLEGLYAAHNCEFRVEKTDKTFTAYVPYL